LQVMSVHIYEQEPLPAFAADHVALIALAAGIARRLGKTLFIGEFGARSSAGLEPRSHLDRALAAIESLRVPYAALWIWEYYQTNTYTSFDHQNTLFNIEPGFSDPLIRRVAAINRAPAAAAAGRKDEAPPLVVIAWPLECAGVERAFTLHVAASDDSGEPPAVEVREGAKRFPAGDRPPYAAHIDGLDPGERELVASAVDRAGNRAEWTTRIVVKPAAGGSARCERCCN
jgi:hypothetical protein